MPCHAVVVTAELCPACCHLLRLLLSSRMLPSKLFKFKNHGIPPPLRSLMVIHPSLSPSLAVQLRLRLRVASQPFLNSIGAPRARRFHSSSRLLQSTISGVSTSSSAESEAQKGQLEPRLQLTFTCSVTDCSERSTHEFTKRAYQKGIVIVQCPKCKNRWLSFLLFCWR